LKIFTSAEVNGEKISGSKTVTVAASQQGSNSNGAASTPSKCLIATAAFGSELSPQVQFLRSFRDNHILATTSGSSFMNVFDAWYYSFSPSIADYERNQPWLQQTVKVAIYPLLGILQVSEKAYLLLPGEYGSLAAGLAASSLIGAVYASPIVLSFKQIRRFKLDCRIAGIIIATSVTSVLVSLSLANQIALMITTSILVVSTLSVAAIVTAKTITRILEKKRKWK
jgi:peptide/nickel transport system substrate-binding protein